MIGGLQLMAARALGPTLPTYCAACGSDFVGVAEVHLGGRALGGRDLAGVLRDVVVR